MCRKTSKTLLNIITGFDRERQSNKSPFNENEEHAKCDKYKIYAMKIGSSSPVLIRMNNILPCLRPQIGLDDRMSCVLRNCSQSRRFRAQACQTL